jgi:hypothetical protein
VLSYCCDVPGFDSLSSPLDGMGFVIVAVLSPSAANLATREPGYSGRSRDAGRSRAA